MYSRKLAGLSIFGPDEPSSNGTTNVSGCDRQYSVLRPLHTDETEYGTRRPEEE